MTVSRLLIGLCVACTGWPVLAGAGAPAAEDTKDQQQHLLGAQLHACMDPSDVLARRQLQAEPCRLPLYELPRAEAPKRLELPRWQSHPPGADASQTGHAMFWRFPVQGHGPQEVPRHSWR